MILWKCLYLLASLKDSPGLGGAYETSRRGEEANPFYGLNSTLIVGKIWCFHSRYAWARTFVFLLTLDRESTDRCFLYACYGNPYLANVQNNVVIDMSEYPRAHSGVHVC
jgi:hypothetical protein